MEDYLKLDIGMRVKLKKYPNEQMQGIPLFISEIKQDMIYLINFGWFHVSLIDLEETKKFNGVEQV